MIYSFLITFILSISVFATPNWFQQRAQFENVYWLAFTSASSSEIAFKKAQALIVAQLEVQVLVKDDFNQKLSNKNNQFYRKTLNKLSIKNKSEQVLTGLQILKEERIGKQVYLCVGLHKKNFINSRLDALNMKIEQGVELEKIIENIQDEPESHLSFLVSMYQVVKDINSETQFLKALGIKENIKQHSFLLTDIELKLIKHLKNYRINIISGDKQKIARAQILKEPIICELQFNNKSITKQKIKVKSFNGELKKQTDNSGNVSYQDIITAKKNTQVKFSLDLDELNVLPYAFKKKLLRLSNLSCIATIYVQKPIQNTIVYSIDFQGNKISENHQVMIEDIIKQQLSYIGINLKKDKKPELFITLNFKIDTINGYGLQYSHKCLTRIIFNFKSNNEMFSFINTSKSSNMVVENLINTVKLDENKLINIFDPRRI